MPNYDPRRVDRAVATLIVVLVAAVLLLSFSLVLAPGWLLANATLVFGSIAIAGSCSLGWLLNVARADVGKPPLGVAREPVDARPVRRIPRGELIPRSEERPVRSDFG